MDEVLSCSKCHVAARPTDYFCYNCGYKLKLKPPSTSILSQIGLYLGSFLVPPMGLIWGWRYFRQPDMKMKTIGLAAAGITIISLILVTQVSKGFINSFNNQLNSQLQLYGY